MKKKNKVYLIGAGPGRPDLITVRGLDILKEADVVIYDYLVNKELLKEKREGAELIQSNGNKDLIVKKVKEGKRVVRLKGGDSSIFGRYSEEVDVLLKNKIDFEVVPGVTAATAAASFSGVPLTDRRYSSNVVFVTGHEDPKKKKSFIDWEKVSRCGTLVLYMAVGNFSGIVNRIINSGKSLDTPVVAISHVGSINQKTVKGRLKDIAKKMKKENITAPAIFIIGKVAGLEKDFNWFRKTKKILFTGLSKERYFTDGLYFHLPMIKITPVDDYVEFDKHLREIKKFDWIVFTSRYGVEHFFKRLKAIGCDSRLLSKIKIAAIGTSTRSRLEDFGIIADLTPKKECSEGLVEEFRRLDIKNKKFFLPRSDIADKGVTKKLKSFDAKVTDVFAYRNIMPDDLPDLDLGMFNEIMFTSPSAVRNFKKRYGKVPQNIKVRWIGDVTKEEVIKCQLQDLED